MSHISPDKIIILFLVYGNKHVQSGLEKIEEIISRMFPSTNTDYLVIDNNLPTSFCGKKANILTIGGDNTLFEFSGWDHAISYMHENMNYSNESLVLFVNDTFHRRDYKQGKDYLDFFDLSIINNKDVMNSAIGYLDDFPRDVSLNGIKYNNWIRSNIFFLPAHIVREIYPLSYSAIFEPQAIFSNDPNYFWSNTDSISENWKAYISSWLFGTINNNYPEYNLNWLKATPAGAENHEYFKKKALCILSEHYLSARLLNMSTPIININIFSKAPSRHITPYYN